MPFPRRSTRSTFRGRGARRRVTWEQISVNFDLGTPLIAQVTDLTIDTIGDQEATGGTVKRMIGEITVEHAAGAQAIERQHVGVGICVITKDALLGSVTPDPINTSTDQNQDWYFWATAERTLGPAGTDNGLIRFPIDIRSMRRLRGGYRLALVTQKDLTELGITVNVSMRLLWSVD